MVARSDGWSLNAASPPPPIPPLNDHSQPKCSNLECPLGVNSGLQVSSSPTSASERKADIKRAASEIQFANVCFRAVSGPRGVIWLMSAISHKRTIEDVTIYSPDAP